MTVSLVIALAFVCAAQGSNSVVSEVSLQELPAKHGRKSGIWFAATLNSTHAKITVRGPTDTWFGVGFARKMYPCNAIIYSSGKDGKLTVGLQDYYMRSKSWYDVKREATQPWILASNVINNGRREIIAVRTLRSPGANKYQFDLKTTSMPLVWAYGRSPGSYILADHGHNKGRHITVNFQQRQKTRPQAPSKPTSQAPSKKPSKKSAKKSSDSQESSAKATSAKTSSAKSKPLLEGKDSKESGDGDEKGSGGGGGQSMSGVATKTCTHGTAKILNHKLSGSSITLGLLVDCDKKTIQVNLKGPSTRWFGILFGTKMPNTDALLFTTGFSGSDLPSLYNYYISGYKSSNVNKVPTQSWKVAQNSSVKTVNGEVSMSFVRALATKNKQQRQFDLSHLIIDIMWAEGRGTRLAKHNNIATSVSHFNLITGQVTQGSNTSGTFHAIVMVIGWALIMPVTVLAARNKKFVGELWFGFHKYGNACSELLIVCGFIAGLVLVGERQLSHFGGTHELFGLFLVIFALAQPINAYFRPAKEERRSRARQIWEYLHKVIGYFAVLAAQVEINLGLSLMFPMGSALTYVHIAWVVLLVLIGIVLEVYKCYSARESSNDGIQMNSVSAGYTRQEESISVEEYDAYEGPGGQPAVGTLA